MVMAVARKVLWHALMLLWSAAVCLIAGLILFAFSCFVESHRAHAGTIKVAVIDTGFDLGDPRFQGHLCQDGHHDFTQRGLGDVSGHGTHVAGLIAANAGKADYCLMVLKYYDAEAPGKVNAGNETEAFRWAADHGADIVNLSGGGPALIESEYLVIKGHPEMTFIVAAGNEHADVTEPGGGYYPAAIPLPNVIVIGNGTSARERCESSNFGKRVDYWIDGRDVDSTLPGGKRGRMTGTSMSTAIWTGRFVSRLAGARRAGTASESAGSPNTRAR